MIYGEWGGEQPSAEGSNAAQPKPLRLADALDRGEYHDKRPAQTASNAAAELRRLYWDELRVREHRDMLAAEITRLHAVNAELLEALKLAVRQNDHDMLMTEDELRVCRAAIAKAEGEQHGTR